MVRLLRRHAALPAFRCIAGGATAPPASRPAVRSMDEAARFTRELPTRKDAHRHPTRFSPIRRVLGPRFVDPLASTAGGNAWVGRGAVLRRSRRRAAAAGPGPEEIVSCHLRIYERVQALTSAERWLATDSGGDDALDARNHDRDGGSTGALQAIRTADRARDRRAGVAPGAFSNGDDEQFPGALRWCRWP
jgi:hypothetical protein